MATVVACWLVCLSVRHCFSWRNTFASLDCSFIFISHFIFGYLSEAFHILSISVCIRNSWAQRFSSQDTFKMYNNVYMCACNVCVYWVEYFRINRSRKRTPMREPPHKHTHTPMATENAINLEIRLPDSVLRLAVL